MILRPGAWAGQRRASGTIHQRGPGPRAGIQDGTRTAAIQLDAAVGSGSPTYDRARSGSNVAAVQTRRFVYAQVEAEKGAKGGLYRHPPRTPGADVDENVKNSSQSCGRAVYSKQRCSSGPKGRRDVWSRELRLSHSTATGGRSFRQRENTPQRATKTHVVLGSNPGDTSAISSRPNDGRRQHSAGQTTELVVESTTSRPPRCTWSNADEQFPTRLRARSRTPGKNLNGRELAGRTEFGVPDDRCSLAAGGPGEGGAVPGGGPIPSGKIIVYGDLQGDVRADENVEDGRNKEFWINPPAAATASCRRKMCSALRGRSGADRDSTRTTRTVSIMTARHACPPCPPGRRRAWTNQPHVTPAKRVTEGK